MKLRQTTPRSLRLALDQITANLIAPEAVAAAETLTAFSPLAGRQLRSTQSIFQSENVIGAGIAEKVTDERETGELGITVYVKEKVPLAELRPSEMIPSVLAGPRGTAIFTDVVVVGEVVAEGPPNKAPPPLRTGFSVSHHAGTAGTLGAFVRRRNKVFMLSNAHVLAQSGTASIGDAILFPGPADGGQNPAARCGELAAFTPFTVGNSFTNQADAALASIAPDLLATINETIRKAARPLRVATPRRGMRVVKRGRTTNNSESVVRDTDFRILVNYPGLGLVGFTGQVRCDRYTEPGDSGSIVVDKDSGAIVGLHFAGSPGISVFTPIRTVMAALPFRF